MKMLRLWEAEGRDGPSASHTLRVVGLRYFISLLYVWLYPTLPSPYKGEEKDSPSSLFPLLCKEG